MEIIINDNQENERLQEFKRGLDDLKTMSPEQRQSDARWILLNSNEPIICGNIKIQGVK